MTSPAGVVTFLFTDLVGSTALIDRLGDDAADDLRRGHFELLRQAVADSGGQEVKNLGDGLMVSFVSPVAALSCATAMQRAVADSGLELRVGLHAGEPAVEGGDYFGTPVVVAKRLCDLARGGQIVASELLAGFVGTRGGFRFRPLGKLPLKGLSEPVAAVEVDLGPTGPPGSGPASARLRRLPLLRATRPRGPGLVGRDEEMNVLESELAAAMAGELRCVLVTGDPGLGKSRLCTELAVRHDDVIALKARGHPMGETTAFGLWAEALDGYLRHLDAADIAALCGGYLEDLASLLRSVAAARGGPPTESPSRQGLLEGITVVLDHLSRAAPVVLVLDDIHEADASSLDCLSYLTHSLAGASILAVLAARPTELAAHPVANRILLSLEQEGLLSRLPLGGLRRERIAELARVVVGGDPPPGLVTWLLDRSQGNPLYALGLLRALLDEGADLAAPRLKRLPEDLAERVRGILGTLDEPALSALELLAVVGRPALVEDLESLLAKSPEQLAAILDTLGRARTVVEEESGAGLAYGISHPLIQETIYQSIGGARRRVLHREVGRSLLAASRPAEAAPHFARSATVGDAEAIEALRLALREAEARRAYREALATLSALVNVLPEGDERWLQIGAVISGEAQWAEHPDSTRADAELGIRALQAIDAVLGPEGDPLRRGTLKVRLTYLLSWGVGDPAEGERAAQEAEALFDAAGDRRNVLLARHEATWARCLRGHMDEARAEWAGILADATALGDPFLMTLVLLAQPQCELTDGHFSEAERSIETGIRLAREALPRPPTALRTLTSLCQALQGRPAVARRLWDEARAADPGYRQGAYFGMRLIAVGFTGDVTGALALAEERLSWCGPLLTAVQSVGFSIAAHAAREAGTPSTARRYLSVWRESRLSEDWWMEGAYGAAVAALLDADEGRDGALDLLAAAIARVEAHPARPFAAALLLDLAELAAGEKDQRVDDAANRLADIASGLDRDIYRALAALAAGWAALGGRSPEAAATRAREALGLLEPPELRLLRGRAYDLLGRALSLTDTAAGREAYTRAIAEFEACGATLRCDRAAGERERPAP